MKTLLLIFLFTSSFTTWALVPIDGIIYGDVEDIKQSDPFIGMFSPRYFESKIFDKQTDNIIYYTALYKQGANLKNSCEGVNGTQYSAFWKEDSAKRSVVAQLQYIGLDLTLKAIVEYAKKLEYTDEKFDILSTNLVKNTCSQNISVYSVRYLLANFKYYWKNPTQFKLPDITDNPYFPDEVKKAHNTYEATKNEFEYTTRLFRTLCSWNLDVDSMGDLASLMRSPFIMTYLINSLTHKTIGIDVKTQEVFTKDKPGPAIQVACENMICRKRNKSAFKYLFPRMDGSSSLAEDLKILYCAEFNRLKIQKKTDEPSSVVNEQNHEVSQFISLITGIPDVNIMSKSFTETRTFFKENIKQRWDKWAERQANILNLEQLYEESLEISLKTQANTYEAEVGDFNLQFNVELGEFDKILDLEDKITSTFYLSFPKSYVKFLRERVTYLYNNKFMKKLAVIERQFVQNIKYQLEQKQKYFDAPLWNDKMAEVVANELSKQFINGRLFERTQKSNTFIKIPVKFYYGVFALQYMRKKYIFRNNLQDSLSFN